MEEQERILQCGEQAFSVELANEIDETVNLRVIALAEDLQANPPDGLLELVPTYRSLLVCFDPGRIAGEALLKVLRDRLDRVRVPKQSTGALWHVPAVYGGEVGLDLDDLAREKGLSRCEFIKLHSGVTYRIYMIGFSPGFCYLGGLPEALHTPRLPQPRMNIPEGAVGIGGRQGNINSVAGPSGWRFIAWTPARIFSPDLPEPFLLRAGDQVRFVPVSADEGTDLACRQGNGETILRPQIHVDPERS